MIKPNNCKICAKCDISKPFSEFSKGTKEKDGLQYNCKQCNKKCSLAYRKNNPEKEKIRHAKYWLNNKDKLNEYQKQWIKNNPKKRKEYSAKWYAEHKESENARKRKWIENNFEREVQKRKKRRLAKIEHIKEYERLYIINNRGAVNAKTRKRVALKFRAIPKWADLNKIKDIYTLAQQKSKNENLEYHVDHIVPLNSKIVCGLHWEENLQIIPASENILKGNRYWPNM